MKQTIDYSGIPEAEKKALDDVKSYLSDVYNKVVEHVSKADSEEEAVMGLAMVGVEGYPAKVFAEYCMKKRNSKGYTTAKGYIHGLARAMGPVDFEDCEYELKEQHPDPWEDYEVAMMINELIKEGKLELWEDGSSFDIPNRYGIDQIGVKK